MHQKKWYQKDIRENKNIEINTTKERKMVLKWVQIELQI